MTILCFQRVRASVTLAHPVAKEADEDGGTRSVTRGTDTFINSQFDAGLNGC